MSVVGLMHTTCSTCSTSIIKSFHCCITLYDRYLHFYEKINHFGQDPNVRDDTVDGDETSGRRKAISALSSVSFSYNYHQHNMTGLYPDMLVNTMLHCC